MTNEIKITYSQEPHPFKTQECELCKKGGAHSPHWYASTNIDGSEKHLYLGGEFRPVFLEDFLKTEGNSTETHSFESKTKKAEWSAGGSSAEGSSEEVKIKKAGSSSTEYQSSGPRPIETVEEKVNGHKQVPASNKISRIVKKRKTEGTILRSNGKDTECQNAEGSPTGPHPNVLETPLPTLPTSKEFYKDLNKFKNVRFKDVKVEYRQLIKKYHPDQYAGQELQVQEWMKIINMVHETHLSRMQRFIR